jgi:electron transfer flavoprotein beta subunit
VAGGAPIPQGPPEREATMIDPDDEGEMERVFAELTGYVAGD